MRLIMFVLLGWLTIGATHAAPPQTFEQAKVWSKNYVYADQNTVGDLYCHCTWKWTGKSGGVMDLTNCGYKVRGQANRAARMEWEHIVPAATFGRQRQCWQNGGRENCNATDPVFNAMEADMFNLYPSVGEANADRSNFNVGMAPNAPPNQYGQCPFKVDFKDRVAEPPAYSKGLIARVHFYMADRYNLRLSRQQEQVLMAWDRAFPITQWEVERDARIARVMGYGNPFVSRQKVWTQGYRPQSNVPAPQVQPSAPRPNVQPQPAAAPANAPVASSAPLVLGNRNSKIYHIRDRCPNYADVSANNAVVFANEQQAQASGFRRAGNCR